MTRKLALAVLTIVALVTFAACTEIGRELGGDEPATLQQTPPGEGASVPTAPAPAPAGEAATSPTMAAPATSTPQPTPTAAGGEWVEYTSEEGGFSVMMPGQPKEDTTGAGDFSLNVEQENAYYTVNYTEMPAATIDLGEEDIKQVLTEAGNGAVSAINGTVISERELTLNGYQGREVRAETSASGMDATYVARIYLVNGHLFQTVVVAETDAMSEEDIQTFLDSFTLTAEAPSPDDMSGTEEEGEASSETEAAWVEYTSDEYGFSVKMPEQPEEIVEGGGGFLVKVSRDTANYRVNISPLPASLAEAGAEEIKQFLAETGNEEVGSIEGTTVSERELPLDGHPGYEIVADVAVGEMDATYTARIYQVENHIFRLIGIAEKESEHIEDVQTFLDSFALRDEGEGTEGETMEGVEGEGTGEPAAEQPAEVPAAAPPTAAGDLLLAVGKSSNLLSILSPEGWMAPTVEPELSACISADALFDENGQPWIACNYLITSADGGQTWSTVEIPQEISLGRKAMLGPNNQIWWIEDKQIVVVDAASSSIVETYAPMQSTGEEFFPTDLATFAPDGTLWLGGMNIKGSELVSFDGTAWKAYGENEDLGVESYENPQGFLVSSDGELLIFTTTAVYTLEDGQLQVAIDEAPTTVNDVIQLPGGEIWVATYSGISIWDGTQWREVTRENGLLSEKISDLAIDASGRVWAATDYGLHVQTGEGWLIALPSDSGIAESRISALAVSGAPQLPPFAEVPKTAPLTGIILLNGTPVADTRVQVCNESGNLFFSETPCEDLSIQEVATTDESGRFTFEALPLASYQLYAVNPQGEEGPEWVDLTFLEKIDLLEVLEAGETMDIGEIELSEGF